MSNNFIILQSLYLTIFGGEIPKKWLRVSIYYMNSTTYKLPYLQLKPLEHNNFLFYFWTTLIGKRILFPKMKKKNFSILI